MSAMVYSNQSCFNLYVMYTDVLHWPMPILCNRLILFNANILLHIETTTPHHICISIHTSEFIYAHSHSPRYCSHTYIEANTQTYLLYTHTDTYKQRHLYLFINVFLQNTYTSQILT